MQKAFLSPRFPSRSTTFIRGAYVMADTPRIENRKARQYYEFLEFFEAGIVLTGPE